MKVSILSVGTEILLGQIANTNAQYISKKLNELGESIIKHVAIGDNPERLEHAIKQELNEHDVLILTGGLGPTKDDLTKQTVAKVLDKQLVLNQEAMDSIENYFKTEKRKMTPNNRQQALVIEGSDVLKNEVGMAPGMYIKDNEKVIVMLPGPPRELKPMVNHYLLPYFINNNRVIFSESLKFTGIGESQLETECMDLIEQQSNPTIAPLAGSHEVSLRITANANTKELAQEMIKPIKNEILNRVGEFYYGSNDITMEEALLEHINQKFIIYDEVTEGVIYSRLNMHEKSKKLLEGYIVPNKQIKKLLEIHSENPDEIIETLQNKFDAKIIVLILQNEEHIILNLKVNQKFKKINYTLNQSHMGKRDRISNIAIIELLNLFRGYK